MDRPDLLPVAICPTQECLALGQTSSLIAIECARCQKSMLRWPWWLGGSAAKAFWALIMAGLIVLAADTSVSGPDSSPVFLLCFLLLMIGVGISLRNHRRRHATVLCIGTATFALAGAHAYLDIPDVANAQLYGFWLPAAFALLYCLVTLWVLVNEFNIRDRVRHMRRRLAPRSAVQFWNPRERGALDGTAVRPPKTDLSVTGNDLIASFVGACLVAAAAAFGLSFASESLSMGLDGVLAQASLATIGTAAVLAALTAIWAGLGATTNGTGTFHPREPRLIQPPVVKIPRGDEAMSPLAVLAFRFWRVAVRTAAMTAASVISVYNVTARGITFALNLVLHFWSFVEAAIRAFAVRLRVLAIESITLAWQSVVHAWRAVLAVTLLLVLESADAVWTSASFRSYMLGTGTDLLVVAGGAALLVAVGGAVVAYLSELPFLDGIPDNLNLVVDVLPWSVLVFIVVDFVLMIIDGQHFRPGTAFWAAIGLTVGFVVLVAIRELSSLAKAASQAVDAKPGTATAAADAEAADRGSGAQRIPPGNAAPVFASVVPAILLLCALIGAPKVAASGLDIDLRLPWMSGAPAPTMGTPARNAGTPAPTARTPAPTAATPFDAEVASIEAAGYSCSTPVRHTTDGSSGVPLVAWTQCGSSDGSLSMWVNVYSSIDDLASGFASRTRGWGNGGSCESAGGGSAIEQWLRGTVPQGDFGCSNRSVQAEIVWTSTDSMILRHLVSKTQPYKSVHAAWTSIP